VQKSDKEAPITLSAARRFLVPEDVMLEDPSCRLRGRLRGMSGAATYTRPWVSILADLEFALRSLALKTDAAL
jgi:hypothetical protein